MSQKIQTQVNNVQPENPNEERLNRLKEDIQRSSSNFSGLARTIAMALCALTWVEFNAKPDCGLLKTTIILIISYFVIELSQYLVTSLYARANFIKLAADLKTLDEVDNTMTKVSNYTVGAVIFKCALLITVGVLLIIFYAVCK